MLLSEGGIEGSVEACDIDIQALAKAQAAIYPPEVLVELPQDLQARFFDIVAEGQRLHYRLHSALRERVGFHRHDIMSGTPFLGGAQFDFIACRNVLIYFNRGAQERALFALLSQVSAGGILCLGKTEWPCAAALDYLEPIDKRERLFRVRATPRGAE
jgi:chemotaxis methyl-accepting protein methylase